MMMEIERHTPRENGAKLTIERDMSGETVIDGESG